MATILGAHSPKISDAKALLTKKGRQEQNRFSFEGPTLLGEALGARVPIESVFVTEKQLDQLPKLQPQTEVFVITDAAMAKLSDVESPSGIVATTPLRLAPLDQMLKGDAPALLLAGVTDPGNAGTLIRSAEAFGFACVLFGHGGVEPYHPKVVRATMGSIFRLPIAHPTFAEFSAAVGASGRTIVATDAEGVPVETYTPPRRAIYAVGSERHGTHAWLERADAYVAITHAGPTESLNAAIAGSIVMYEVTRSTRSS